MNGYLTCYFKKDANKELAYSRYEHTSLNGGLRD